MRLDHVTNLHPLSPRASVAAAATTAGTTAPAKAAADATDSQAAATFTVTATWQWSVSLQVSTALDSGSATTPATVGAPDREVDQADGDHHGRPHVSQLLRQLSRAVRHELRAMIRNNPDLDPAVRQELRATAKEFRDALKTAFHDAGRGDQFDPAALLEGVRQALLTLADRLGRIAGEPPQPAEPVPAPAEDPAPAPTPEPPASEVPAEAPVPAAA